MHWILQDNLFDENNYCALVNSLERLNISYAVVKVVPFSQGLPWDQKIMPCAYPPGRVMAIEHMEF